MPNVKAEPKRAAAFVFLYQLFFVYVHLLSCLLLSSICLRHPLVFATDHGPVSSPHPDEWWLYFLRTFCFIVILYDHVPSYAVIFPWLFPNVLSSSFCFSFWCVCRSLERILDMAR